MPENRRFEQQRGEWMFAVVRVTGSTGRIRMKGYDRTRESWSQP